MEVGEGLREQVWGMDGGLARSGKGGMPRRLQTSQGIPDSGATQGRFPLTVPSVQGAFGPLRTLGPSTLTAVTGLGEPTVCCQGLARPPGAPASFCTHWEPQ